MNRQLMRREREIVVKATPAEKWVLGLILGSVSFMVLVSVVVQLLPPVMDLPIVGRVEIKGES